MNTPLERQVREIEIRIRVSARLLRFLFLALIVALPATELSSESVTLSTYYPAPSGIYNKMITTGVTLLGTSNGFVGVNTPLPINPNMATGITLDVNGRIRTGYGGSGGVWLDSLATTGGGAAPNPGDIFIGQHQYASPIPGRPASAQNYLGFWTQGATGVAGTNWATVEIAQNGLFQFVPRDPPSVANNGQDGAIYYDRGTNRFMGRANGVWAPLGGVRPMSATPNNGNTFRTPDSNSGFCPQTPKKTYVCGFNCNGDCDGDEMYLYCCPFE